MRSRRAFLALVGAASTAFVVPARAFEVQPYDPAAAQKAIASGKPVGVHVAAWWCLQCHAQTAILDSLKKDPAYDGVSVFRVDYDKQKDVVGKLDCPRATLIAYKGGTISGGEIRLGLLDTRVDVETRGGLLTIEWQGGTSPLLMTGPAETVFEGEIEL